MAVVMGSLYGKTRNQFALILFGKISTITWLATEESIAIVMLPPAGFCEYCSSFARRQIQTLGPTVTGTGKQKINKESNIFKNKFKQNKRLEKFHFRSVVSKPSTSWPNCH